MIMNKIFRISALVLLLCLTSGIAAADEELPQIPEEFWGSVSINGVPAPAGTAISATIDGQEVGSVVTTDKGSYGGASRQEGEHLLISANSGMIDHEITFLVNGNPADQTEIFTPDNAKELDLTVTTKEPVAGFTASPTSGNAPLKVTFTDTSTGNPDSWLWDFGDGTSATGQDAGHTYNSAGKFSVRLTVSNIYGSSSTSATITVSSSGGGGTGGGGSGGSTGGGVISPSTVQVQTATTTGTLSTD